MRPLCLMLALMPIATLAPGCGAQVREDRGGDDRSYRRYDDRVRDDRVYDDSAPSRVYEPRPVAADDRGYSRYDGYDRPAPRYRDEPAVVEESDSAPVEVVAGPEVEVEVFHEQLSPYGRWVRTEEYGECWTPADVGADWRPYTVGRWVQTDYGWTFVSEERFGYATYHYGRWALTPRFGWVWVPGRHWGPAWVAWRSGGGYCGWAPLPPETVDRDEISEYEVRRIPDRDYVFCEERYVSEPRVYRHCEPEERSVTFVRRTTNITNITVVNNRVINRGLPQEDLRRYAAAPIPRVEVRRVDTLNEVRAVHEQAIERRGRGPSAADDRAVRRDEQQLQHDTLHDQHVVQHDTLHEQHAAEHDAAHEQRIQINQQRNAQQEALRQEEISAREAERQRQAEERAAVEQRQNGGHDAAHAARVAEEQRARDEQAAADARARQRRADEGQQAQESHAAAHEKHVNEQDAARAQRAAEEQRARDAEAAHAQRAADEQRARDAEAAHAQRAADEQRARDAQRAAEEQHASDRDAATRAQRAADAQRAREQHDKAAQDARNKNGANGQNGPN